MMWFFRHFWIFISYHIFLLNQVEGAIAIPPSNSAPLPLFCPSVCPSVCPSIGLLTTFSGFCTFADKSLGRNGIELEMQMFPDDLPLAKIDADGYCCHFMRSSVRPTIHGLGFVYCIQSAWKKWPTIWHADVSRWLTLSIHGCLWILLLVCLSVHLSVCSFTAFSGGCAFADKSLGTNGVIIGRWLLPSLVDTGDICCHYWQHILVIYWHIFHSGGFHHICNIKCRLDYRYSPQNIFNAKNFSPHKKPISLLNVLICTKGMQRTWWPEAVKPVLSLSLDRIVSASPTLLLNAMLARWAQFCKDCYIISTCTPSCPATGTAWLWGLAQAGAWLCYPLRWLSIYNKEWDITVIQPISSTSTSELFRKALVDVWIDLYLLKFQFLAILCVFCLPFT